MSLKRKLKILEVVFALSSGGAERVVTDLCNDFAARGHEVTLLTILDLDRDPALSFGRSAISEKVKILQLKTKYPTPAALFRLHRILKAEKPDIIHMHLNVLPYFFCFALKRSGCRFFHTLHSVASAACGYPLQRGINRWFYKTRRITPVTISKLCDESFQSFYELPAAACITNGRNRPVPSAQEEEAATQIEELKLHADDLVFVQVGTLYKLKNQLASVRIFGELHRRKKHAVLLLIGKRCDAEYYDKLTEIMPPNVHYLGERKNVADYLLHSDYFLMPSLYEGLPISLLEAMACGCIPICTAVGGIPDVVDNSTNGYLVPPEDEAALLSCVEKRLDAPEKILPQDIVDDYLKRFDISRCADKYLQMFNGTDGQDR